MTRETKIGMLVGLAFIIVIGILLSDHMTSTTEPQKAQLADAGDAVRRGATTPAASSAPPVTALIATPPTAPSEIVPTRDALNARAAAPPAGQDIVVGGPAGAGSAVAGATPQQIQIQGTPIANGQPPAGAGSPPPSVITPPSGPAPAAPVSPDPVAAAAGPVVPAGGAPVAGEDALARWAREHSQQLVPVDGPGAAPRPQPQQPQPVPMAAVRQYKAEPGDNLSKMASRLMGQNSKANRDAIVRANPTLQKDPNRVIVGRVYSIPTAAGEAAAPPAPVVASSPPAPVAPAAPAPRDAAASARTPAAPADSAQTAAAAGGFRWYTVQENDNLWNIAADQLGSGNEWAKLKELNKDILKGGETVHPNMRLRLPAKPVASAAQ